MQQNQLIRFNAQHDLHQYRGSFHSQSLTSTKQ